MQQSQLPSCVETPYKHQPETTWVRRRSSRGPSSPGDHVVLRKIMAAVSLFCQVQHNNCFNQDLAQTQHLQRGYWSPPGSQMAQRRVFNVHASMTQLFVEQTHRGWHVALHGQKHTHSDPGVADSLGGHNAQELYQCDECRRSFRFVWSWNVQVEFLFSTWEIKR